MKIEWEDPDYPATDQNLRIAKDTFDDGSVQYRVEYRFFKRRHFLSSDYVPSDTWGTGYVYVTNSNRTWRESFIYPTIEQARKKLNEVKSAYQQRLDKYKIRTKVTTIER